MTTTLHARPSVELPGEPTRPVERLGRRLAVGLGLILFVALLAYVGRAGYEDANGTEIGVLDSLYYATVSITTTGYGDIHPETDGARLVSTVLVTPARIVFLILVVGTTVELLAGRTHAAYRLKRWRKRLKDHIVICGFGTKGRSALQTLTGRGIDPEQVVVIDEREDAREQARAMGVAAVAGNASRSEVLEAAEIGSARGVVVAPDRDDAAVLITLTARERNRTATIVSAVREEENAHLLRESGADSVIASSGAAGRLLGFATHSPQLVQVLEDLMAVGRGLEIVEREIRVVEAGPIEALAWREPVVAVVRDGEMFRFDDTRASELLPGDRVICLSSEE